MKCSDNLEVVCDNASYPLESFNFATYSCSLYIWAEILRQHFLLSLILQSCHCQKDYPLYTYSVLSGYCFKKVRPYLKNALYLVSNKSYWEKEFWRVDRSQCWESWQRCILRLLFSNSRFHAEIAESTKWCIFTYSHSKQQTSHLLPQTPRWLVLWRYPVSLLVKPFFVLVVWT